MGDTPSYSEDFPEADRDTLEEAIRASRATRPELVGDQEPLLSGWVLVALWVDPVAGEEGRTLTTCTRSANMAWPMKQGLLFEALHEMGGD